jgi:hypothetical protein
MRIPDRSGGGVPSRHGFTRLALGGVRLRGRAFRKHSPGRSRTVIARPRPRVPAWPEEVTIMQSTYGSDPKGATP